MFSSSSGCCWSPSEMMLGRKKLLFRVGGRPVWLRECWIFEMQKRRGRRSDSEGVKIATKLSLDLLYTVAGVSCKMKPVAKLEYLKIWYCPGLSYSPSGQSPWHSLAGSLPINLVPPLLEGEGGEKKKNNQNIWVIISPSSNGLLRKSVKWWGVQNVAKNTYSSNYVTHLCKIQGFTNAATLWSISHNLIIFSFCPIQLINYLLWETTDSYCFYCYCYLCCCFQRTEFSTETFSVVKYFSL